MSKIGTPATIVAPDSLQPDYARRSNYSRERLNRQTANDLRNLQWRVETADNSITGLQYLAVKPVGLTLAPYSGDPDAGITIAPGYCTDSTRTAILALDTSLTKRIDATWSMGSGAGGLESGSVAANTYYYPWLIQRESDGTLDALFSTSRTSPALPSGWEAGRRLGVVRTDASSGVIDFVQYGDDFYYREKFLAGGSVSTSGVIYDLSIYAPPLMLGHFGLYMSNTSSTTSVVRVYHYNEDTSAPVTTSNYDLIAESDINPRYSTARDILVDPSSKIRFKFGGYAASAHTTFFATTYGWRDLRDD